MSLQRLDQIKSNVNREMLIGSWKLILWQHQREDGSIYCPMGKDALGQIVYTAYGQMSVTLSQANRPTFEKPGLFDGNVDEKASAMGSFIAYSGRFEFLGDRVIHHLELSLFPNWLGTRQERFLQMEGNSTLILSSPPFIASSGRPERATLIWRKTDTHSETPCLGRSKEGLNA